MIVASWTPASGHAICGGFLSSGPQHEIRFGILLSWLSHPLSRHSICVCSVRWCRTLALFRSCLTASVKVRVTVPAYWITEGGAALLDHVEPRRHLLWVVSVSFVKCETSQTITSVQANSTLSCRAISRVMSREVGFGVGWLMIGPAALWRLVFALWLRRGSYFDTFAWSRSMETVSVGALRRYYDR